MDVSDHLHTTLRNFPGGTGAFNIAFRSSNCDYFYPECGTFGYRPIPAFPVSDVDLDVRSYIILSFTTNVQNFGASYDSIRILATVHDSVDLTDVVPTPLPNALPLFAIGLGALGLIACRRKQKVAA